MVKNHWVVLRQYLFKSTADRDLIKPFKQLKLTLSAGSVFQILTTRSGAKKVFAKVCSSFRHAEFVAVSSGLSDCANSKEVRYFNFGDASNDFISKN